VDRPPSPSADSLLTVDEIARILKLNPQTVRNWIDRGYLGAIRIGRRVRVPRAEFDRLIAESHTGGRKSEQSPQAGSGYTAEGFWSGDPHPGPQARCAVG
jgi:excisionase family DNA binding protein